MLFCFVMNLHRQSPSFVLFFFIAWKHQSILKVFSIINSWYYIYLFLYFCMSNTFLSESLIFKFLQSGNKFNNKLLKL